MKLAQELMDIRGLALGHATSPQLGNSSLDGGRIEFRDGNGSTVGGIGVDDDGGITVTYEEGPKPPRPSAPSVTADAGLISISWDGSFEPDDGDSPDGVLATSDCDRVEVHASQDENFVPDRVMSFGGAFSSLDGGSFVLGPLPEAGPWYVCLVTRSKANKYSKPSTRVEQEVAIASIDLAITDAWMTGEAAQTTADGKNGIYRGPDEPAEDPDAPFTDGDIWFEMNDDGESIPNIWDEDAGEWVSNRDARQSAIEKVQTELREDLDSIVVDGSGTKNFYRGTMPTDAESSEGDLWFDSSEENKPYIYEDGVWITVRDSFIEDESVTTSKIAVGAITAESGIIGSINAGTITVGEMSGARIKANTIAADRILLGTGGNLAPWDQVRRGETVEPHETFSSGNADGTLAIGQEDTTRGVPAHMVHTRTSSQTGAYGPVLMAGPGQRILGEPGKSYTVTFKVYSDDMVCAISPRVYWYTSDSEYLSSTFAPTEMRFNLSPTPQQVSFTVVMPAAARQVVPMVATSGVIAERTGDIHIVDWQLKETIGATLIEGGAITTEHIKAGAITAESGIIGSIDANVITVGKIMGNQIDGDAINGKTITGAKIRTAASGSRVELTHDGLKQYNSLGATIVDMTAGSFALEGGEIVGSTIKTARSGSRVELDEDGLRQYDSSDKKIVEMRAGGMVLENGYLMAKGFGAGTGHISYHPSLDYPVAVEMTSGTDIDSYGNIKTRDKRGNIMFEVNSVRNEMRLAAPALISGDLKVDSGSLSVLDSSTSNTAIDLRIGRDKYGRPALAAQSPIWAGESAFAYEAGSLGGPVITAPPMSSSDDRYGLLRINANSAFFGLGGTESGDKYGFAKVDSSGQLTLVGEGGSDLGLRKDGTGPRIYSHSIRDRHYSSGANVFITSHGTLGKSTSARKYKADERSVATSLYADALLSIDYKSWIDKGEQALHEEYLEFREANPMAPVLERLGEASQEAPDRRVGAIAEDFVDAGLEEFVTYDQFGEVDGLQYDRIGPALIPIVRELRDRIEQLETQLASA